MRTASPGDVVSPDDLLAQIRRRFPDLVLTTTWGARALRYHSGDALGHGVEFVTVEERDGASDPRSALDAIGAYRLCFGVTAACFEALFGVSPAWGAGADPARAGSTPVDTIVPHPVYAWMSWAAVVNPSPATLERLWPLLDEGYARARAAHACRGGDGVPQAR